MITGSGNRYMSTVRIDGRNSSAQVWWCESKQEWHWMLVWEDGGPYGTHIHHGVTESKVKARAGVVKAIIWIEDNWPRLSYFEGSS